MDNIRFRGRDYYYMGIAVLYLVLAYFRPERVYTIEGALFLLLLFGLPLLYEVCKICESESEGVD